MADRRAQQELLTYPCVYEYKVFGLVADDRFVDAVLAAVSRVAPVTREAVRTRRSSAGRYQCVTVQVRLETGEQLSQIYDHIRALAGVCYLL